MIAEGDYVTIAASRYPFASIQSKQKQGDWFDSLSRTLQVGSELLQQHVVTKQTDTSLFFIVELTHSEAKGF